MMRGDFGPGLHGMRDSEQLRDGTAFREHPARLRSPRYVRFFTGVMARRMRHGFAAVRFCQPPSPCMSVDGPLVVYCNHPSWWDPAFMSVLAARLFPDRKAYAPMDARALERYGFMKRCGLFGIEPESAGGASRFLRTSADLLARADTLLYITPQGRFADARQRPLAFERGLAALLVRRPDAVVVPLALEYAFWNESRPEAFARFGPPVATKRSDDGRLGRPVELHERLVSALEAQMDELAREVVARDASRFVTLIDGEVGVGGIYGIWQRLTAWASGQRFDPHHDPSSSSSAQR